MTNADNPCIVCGSQSENFDEKYCSKDCYTKHTGDENGRGY